VPQLVPASAEQLLAHVRASEAKVVVLNMWATWCDPCKAELPGFLAVHEAYRARGLELILVSADAPGERPAVEAFLGSQKIDFNTYLRDGPDMAFIEKMDPRWTGSLPATFVFAHGGELRRFVEGPLTREALESLVRAVLDTSP
jgi:thiol-disulfide isomerase/thioredoxin